MKKILTIEDCSPHAVKKALLIMKLTSLLILVATLQVSARVSGQGKVSLKLNQVEISKALHSIEGLGTYRFLYNSRLEAVSHKVNIDMTNSAIGDVLNKLFAGTDLSYKMLENNLIVVVSSTLAVQDIRITGKVTSTTGDPLQGVSVTVKGTTIGTTTDNNGGFALTVPQTGTLVFSSIGFDTHEQPITDSGVVNVSLAASNKVLDQVVVVGYGTQRRGDLTGAIGSVKGADISKQQVLTATQAIQGKVAGVQIISSGDPNSNPTVHIRGIGTTLGGVSPLFVVDGVITDDIRNINSADIVSIDVLKDASSTAIYGVRAANGVLLITTKKGKRGKPVVAYDGSVGVKEISKLVNMAGPHQYANYINEGNIYYGTGDTVISNAMLAAGANTDWFDAIIKRSLIQNHNISVSGGSENADYFLSAGYITDGGIIQTNAFKRFTVRSNNDYRITNNFKVSTLVSYSRTILRDVDLNNFNLAYRAAPYVPAKIGNLYGNTSLANNVGNPLLNLDDVSNGTVDNRLQATIVAEYKPLPWITLHSSLGTDLDFYNNTNYDYLYLNSGPGNVFLTAGGNQYVNNSTLALTKNNYTRWLWDNTVTLAKTFDKHNFTLLAGTTAETFTSNSFLGSVKDVPPSPDRRYLSQGTLTTATVTNSGDKYTRESYIGRLNYNFDQRYYVTASIRADASSKFPSYDRWGYFPSVALAWNLAHENFFSGLNKTFDQLKIRGSWGKVGNDNIISNAYIPLATPNVPYFFNNGQYNGISFDAAANPNLKWETSKEYDLGLDFAVLHNRLNGTIDLYNKKTNNALIYVNFPGVYIGDVDNNYITNAADIRNKGIELSLNWSDNIDNNWKYSIGGNIAFNQNRVIGLNGGQALYDGNLNGYQVTKTDNGQPIGAFFLRQFDGIFQNAAQIANSAQKSAQVGDIRYKDISGPNGKQDGVIDDFDRAFSGSYQPKYTYGITGSVSYKTFDLSFNTYGTHGGKIYNGKKQLTGSDPYDNIETKVATGRWTVNNPSNSIPRATIGTLPASTYFLESGNFFRINNITLGYTLPKPFLTKAKFQNLRIYVTTQNPFTFTKYSGFTPELAPPINTLSSTPSTTNAGIEQAIYPSTRSLSGGINFSF